MTEKEYITKTVRETVLSLKGIRDPHNIIVTKEEEKFCVSLHVRIWGDYNEIESEMILRYIIDCITHRTGIEPERITIQVEKHKPCPNPQKQ